MSLYHANAKYLLDGKDMVTISCGRTDGRNFMVTSPVPLAIHCLAIIARHSAWQSGHDAIFVCLTGNATRAGPDPVFCEKCDSSKNDEVEIDPWSRQWRKRRMG
jgi:hypothetical protein